MYPFLCTTSDSVFTEVFKSSANITPDQQISYFNRTKIENIFLHIWQIWLGDNLHAFHAILKHYLKLSEPVFKYTIDISI